MHDPQLNPPEHRRRRRRHSSQRRAIPRPVLALGIIALIALVGVGIAILGTGGPGVSTPTATPSSIAVGTLPPLPPLPSGDIAPGTEPPDASGSPSPSGLPSASPGKGVVANRIVISRLGIDLPVVKGDGIDAPIGKAAHYPGTGWPNGGTNIYLYAHARDGMFIGLWNAQVGDTIDLQLVDGTTKTYVVSQVLPKVKWNAMQYLDPTPTEELTLQTCTSYENTAPRFLVIAVPQS